MTQFLRTRPATTVAMLAVYDDGAAIRHGLAFEAALARAQADPPLADEIAQACASIEIDPAELAEEAAHAGTLAIPLVARLRAALSEQAAQAVHRGATSQDLADTIMVLQAKDATALVDANVMRLTEALAVIADRHAETPAVGRTLLQDALPITFGLRAAQWLAGVHDAGRDFRSASDRALLLQFGGAVGTRAASPAIAAALGLRIPPAPWHARRGAIAGLGASLGILIGVIAKVARDIALLAQQGIAEAHEPFAPGRGGSSAMAHKRNPTGCQIALSAALRAPGLVAGMLAGLPQELERGLGGWQAEAPVLADLFMLADGAAEAMANVAEDLDVDAAAMARNLAAAGIGCHVGDSASLARTLVERYRENR